MNAVSSVRKFLWHLESPPQLVNLLQDKTSIPWLCADDKLGTFLAPNMNHCVGDNSDNMNRITILALLTTLLSCNTQKVEKQNNLYNLTISPSIDNSKALNQQIIETLEQFLQTKNDSYYENPYWLRSDFPTFNFPFLDIYKIENKDSIKNFYQPTLMEIIDTDEENKKLLKLAFIGHDSSTKETTIKCIYNILSITSGKDVKFSNPLPYRTKDWIKISKGSVNYVVSPQKKFNPEEAKAQLTDIKKICEFYNINPLSITYYSCVSLKELFEIKGFDYEPRMYIDGGGGLASRYNIIFSGNSTEHYTHEILHLYTTTLYPSISSLINEGMSTYIGGARDYSYSWHKDNLRKYIENNSDIDFSNHLEPFERLYAGETSIPYMIGALICERTYRLYGKEKLFMLLQGERDLWDLLNEVGLSKENFDTELKEEMLLPPTLCI